MINDPVEGKLIRSPDYCFEQAKEEAEEQKVVLDKQAYEKMTEAQENTVTLFKEISERMNKMEDEGKSANDAYGELKEKVQKLGEDIKDNVVALNEKGEGEKPKWLTDLEKFAEEQRQKNETEFSELRKLVTDTKSEIDGLMRFNKKYQDPSHIPGFSDITKEKEKFSFLKYILGSYYSAGGRDSNHDLVSEPWKGGEYERDLIIEMGRRKSEFGEVYRDITFATNDASDNIPAVARIGATRDSLDTSQRGGVLFPDGVMDALIVPLLANSLSSQLGMTVITDLGRNKSLAVPMLESGSLPDGSGWIGEGGEIGVGKSKFKTRKLTPKKYAGRVAVTREALISITPTQEMAWRNYLIDLFRLNALSKPIFSGTGTGAGTDSHGEGQTAQPNGLLNDAGIPSAHKIDKSTANAGADFSLDYARELIEVIEDANASELPNLKWVMRKSMCTVINWSTIAHYSGQGKDANPGYLFLPLIQMGGMLNGLGGFEMVGNNNVPNDLTKGTASNLTCIGLGNWSDYYQAVWRGMGVQYNPFSEDMWTHDMIEMRVIIETDLLNVRPSAFGYITRLKRGY